MLCVPIVIVACVIFVAITDEFRLVDSDIAAMLVFSGAPLLCAIAWLLVWYRVIRWTLKRRLSTITLLGVGVFVEGAVAIVLYGRLGGRRWNWEQVVALTNLPIGLCVFMACIWVWMETNKERLARVRTAGPVGRLCPACRYDMSGLTNLTCPECGTAYTLGRLVDEHQRAVVPADFDVVPVSPSKQ